MSNETEVCEVSECENPVQVTVSQEETSKQRDVCHECVMIAMSMMETDE
jgi:hypothetical protein